MKTKVYENYIEEYKKEKEINYFYAKDNLLNTLYGFEDRGEFTIEVLDEMLELKELQRKIEVLTYIIKHLDYLDIWNDFNTSELEEIIKGEENE